MALIHEARIWVFWVLLNLLLVASPHAHTQTAGVFNVCDFGAVGDGRANDSVAIQKSIDACAATGGGQVLLPGGKTFLAGAIVLKSGVDFHIARGAVLKSSSNWRDFLPGGALLFAKDATGISISGDGTLDGNDKAVWQRLADEEAGGDINKPGWWPQAFCGNWWPFWQDPGQASTRAGRPRAILLVGCKQVRIRHLTIRNASTWTIHPAGCDDLVIDSISILNDWNVPNNDGIDPDHCRNVRISNCNIDTADDGIVIKNTPNFAEYGPSENITVTGCTIASRSSALKLDEAYSPPGIRNMVFDACVVFRSNRGLCVQSRDEGNIENVLFSNITVETGFSPQKWWGAAEPIHISHWPRTAATKLGQVRQIRFTNILCRSETGVYLQGWEKQPIEDVVLENVRLQIGKTTAQPGGYYDARPDGLFKGVYTNVIAGVHAQFVKGLTLRDTQVAWEGRIEDYYGAALEARNVSDLGLQQFKGKAAHPNQTPDQIIE